MEIKTFKFIDRFMEDDITSYFTSSLPVQVSSGSNSRNMKMAILHMNFEDTKVTCFTMDAKVSIGDMIGAIGGTLGLFIGFSFMGTLDDIINFILAVWNKCNKTK